MIDAAVTLLDESGEASLTFKALTTRLATGNGAIYHHVANKADLMASAAERIVTTVLDELKAPLELTTTVRTASVELFDAVDAHPWLGTQLAREPRQPAMLEIFEAFGSRLQALDLSDEVLFNCTFTLVSYVLSAAAQNAANGRMSAGDVDRTGSLQATASQWSGLDSKRIPIPPNRGLSARRA